MQAQHRTTHYQDVSSWELSDSFWERCKPFLPKAKSRLRGRGKRRKHIGGRPPADSRKVLAGILYVLRTGCQWGAAPRREFGSGKTLHRYFQAWSRRGVFKKLWRAGLLEYDARIGLEWRWQAADGCITKAPLGGALTGLNPADRGKSGSRRSLLVEANGIPLALVVGPANRNDAKLLAATLDGIVVERPDSEDEEQNLCLDKGYAGQPTQDLAEKQGYQAHVPDKANAKQKRKRKPGRRKARRYVVEIVCTQMTKTDGFTRRPCRNRVADFHLIAGDHDSINEQLYQLPALCKGGIG